MTEPDPASQAARRAFSTRAFAPGHAVANVHAAVEVLEAAFASGALVRTAALDAMLADLAAAVDPGTGRAGGKSAEAARLIARAIDRELARQT